MGKRHDFLRIIVLQQFFDLPGRIVERADRQIDILRRIADGLPPSTARRLSVMIFFVLTGLSAIRKYGNVRQISKK